MMSIRKMICAGLFVGSLAAMQAAAAAELVVYNVAQAKGRNSGNVLQLDLNTAGNVSGFNFIVRLGMAEGTKLDLSKCVGSLPAGFSGECRVTGGDVYVFAMANGRETLPAGEVQVGSIEFGGASLAKLRGAVTIDSLELADVDGNSISATAVLD